MLRQVCIATVVLLAGAGLSGVLVEDAAGSFTGTKKLRSFSLLGVEQQNHFFVLEFLPEDGETFDRYYFELDTEAGAAHIQVRLVNGINPASPEITCEGVISGTAGFHVHKMCDIRPGHHYRIDTRSTFPATLVLYGFDPISPPQDGGGQPLCYVGLC